MLLNEHVEHVYWGIAEELVPVDPIHRFRWNTELLPGLGGEHVVALH